MSLWQGLLKGIEYKKAVEAAVDSYNSGDSLPEIIRSFAIETEGTLDDSWAHEAEVSLRTAIDVANTVAGKTIEIAGYVEDNTPKVITALEAIDRFINTEVGPGLNKLNTFVSNGSVDLVELVAKVGVFAVQVKNRTEKLTKSVK